MSTQRAFVIQFRPETEAAQERWEGRVEHVASGQATHFRTLDELLAFMARILRKAPAPASQESTEMNSGNL